MREDSTEADSVLVPPVHTRLLAPSDDQDSGGGFDMSGGDEVAVSSQPSVVHVLLLFSEVIQLFVGGCGGGQCGSTTVLRGRQTVCRPVAPCRSLSSPVISVG